MKSLYVVVLNYNGYENTVICVQSLVKSRIPQGFSFKIVIVDNASKEEEGKKLKKDFPKAITILNSKNLGYSGGNNSGIEFSLSQGATHILVINNDTLVLRDSLYEMILGMREGNFDVVCPKIYFEKGFEYHKDRYRKADLGRVFWFAGAEMDWNNVIGSHRGVDQVDHGQFDTEKNMDFMTGACFLAKREVFEKAGMFNDDYFLYYEDADLSMRIKESGFRMGFISKSVIFHKNAGSVGGSGSSLQDYFITRNRLLFGMHYAPIRARIALFREGVKLLATGRKWQKRGVLDYYQRKFEKGSYPIA